MSNEDRVYASLNGEQSECDDCLSSQTGVSPRQQVNQICRHLHASGDILRFYGVCRRCGKTKLVNRLNLKRIRSMEMPQHLHTVYGADHRPLGKRLLNGLLGLFRKAPPLTVDTADEILGMPKPPSLPSDRATLHGLSFRAIGEFWIGEVGLQFFLAPTFERLGGIFALTCGDHVKFVGSSAEPIRTALSTYIRPQDDRDYELNNWIVEDLQGEKAFRIHLRISLRSNAVTSELVEEIQCEKQELIERFRPAWNSKLS